jgi:hypothetical protein
VSVKLITTNNIFEDIFLPLSQRNKSNEKDGNQQLQASPVPFKPRSTLLNISYPGESLDKSSSIGLSNNNNEGNELRTYFYRYIGFENKDDYIKKLILLNERMSLLGNSELKLSNSIPQPYNSELTERVKDVLNSLSELDIRNEKLIEALNKEEIFKLTGSSLINERIKGAFLTVMKLFYINEPVASLSIEQNFIVKLIIWAKEYLPKLYSAQGEDILPKVAYFGSIKKHEVYFLIMLSQTGCDVLYINSSSDNDYIKIDKKSDFSILKENENKADIKFEFKDIKVEKQIEGKLSINVAKKVEGRLNLDLQRTAPAGDNAVTILRKAIDIFEDIVFPLSNRLGYIGPPSPTLPIYFYRYIGFQNNNLLGEDEYYNRIFSLDKKLTALNCGYVKFTNGIPMPFTEEIDIVVNKLMGVFKGALIKDKSNIIKGIIRYGILSGSMDPIFIKLVNDAFEKVVDMYLNNESTVNINRLENFIYKIVVWINRYYNQLFKNKNFVDSPKILFYGDIKAHEVYFLLFLSFIGCDILYLNTEEIKDKPFKEIDPGEDFSYLLLNDKTAPLKSFPEKEKVLRKTTTAFNASQEIEKIIFSEEVGMFKPWQFEDYTTSPITLKTTLDELKILWAQDSKFRPEFKIQMGTVYVPNLFAKINGTQESLEEYWSDIKDFSKAQNTHLMRNVPFTRVNYTKQEKYSAAFLLNRDGNINKELLLGSKLYKFGYLRTSLQNFLLVKLNELLSSNVFKKVIDNDFRLTILMAIINLDEEILKLLETFDYPGNVPKIVIYNNLKEQFSDEDSIIIAFLNSVGFDIVIFTPTNYNTIEQKLRDDLFDKFQLPSIHYELQLSEAVNQENLSDKSKSIFSRILGKRQ